MRDGYFESYKSEVAAYELDKLLSLNMVPPVVERRVNNDLGAAIMWVDGVDPGNRYKSCQSRRRGDSSWRG